MENVPLKVFAGSIEDRSIRAQKPFHDADGKVVPGLSVTHSWPRGGSHPEQTRYSITGAKPIHWLDFDKDESLRQLRLILARDWGDPVVIPNALRCVRAGLIAPDTPVFHLENSVADDDMFRLRRRRGPRHRRKLGEFAEAT